MIVKASFKMGESTYMIEADKPEAKDALYDAITLSSPPRKCDHCGNTENLYFTSNKDKDGNIYINVKCPKCEARAGLGSLKAGGFFWKKFEVYIPKTE